MPNGWVDEPGYDETVTRHSGDYPGAHADTCTLTTDPGVHADDRVRLRATCYFDDCPPGCGGFTVWPRSHKLIWNHTRKCMRDCEAYHPYQAEVLQEMKARTEPVETHGPAGTVVLWHQKTVHIAGHNRSTDVIRQAMIHNFIKTPAAVPDELLTGFGDDMDIWRDWSAELRAARDEARL